MRLHIRLADALVAELDERRGSQPRSTFIGEMIRRALDDEQRWNELVGSLAAISTTGHDWDVDVAEWVREQREDGRRAG